MRIIGRRMSAVLPACLTFLAFVPSSALGASSREKLPQQTLLYIEVAGTETCGDAMRTTPLGKLLDRPEVQALGSALWQAGQGFLMAQAQQEGAGETAAAAKDVLLALWKKGLSIDLTRIEFGETGPSFSLIVASQMGNDADAFLSKFDALLDTLPLPPRGEDQVGEKTFKRIVPPMPFPLPIRYGTADGLFLLTVGEPTAADVLAVLAGDAPSLATNERLNAAMARIGTDNRLTTGLLHIDTTEALAQGRQVFAAMTGQPEPGFPPPVAAIIEETGLGALQSVTLCSQIADNGFRVSAWLASSGAEKGLLKILRAEPLTDDDLIWIPKDASFASAANLNLTAIYDEILRILQVLPGAPIAELQAEIAKVEQDTGLKIRDDILAAFGDGLTAFDAPSTGGLLFTGVTVVAQVRDAENAESLVRRAAEALVKAVGQQAPASVLTAERKKYKLNFIQFAKGPVPVAPTWAVLKDRIVFGLTPQVVEATAERVLADDAQAKSILANPDFTRGRKLLPASLISIVYIDTPAGVRELYPLVALGGEAGISYARSVGIPIDASMLPSLDAVTCNLYGHVGGATIDDAGLLKVSYGPLPVPVVGPGSGGIMTAPLLISILTPKLAQTRDLSRTRDLSERTASMANLREIGTACLLYAYEHQEKFPPDLETLVDRGDITIKVLHSPCAPDDLRSYMYIPGHTKNSNPNWVVAYESWPGQPEEGAPVLFVDGRVEFVKPLSRVADLVEQTKTEMATQEQ